MVSMRRKGLRSWLLWDCLAISLTAGPEVRRKAQTQVLASVGLPGNKLNCRPRSEEKAQTQVLPAVGLAGNKLNCRSTCEETGRYGVYFSA